MENILLEKPIPPNTIHCGAYIMMAQPLMQGKEKMGRVPEPSAV